MFSVGERFVAPANIDTGIGPKGAAYFTFQTKKSHNVFAKSGQLFSATKSRAKTPKNPMPRQSIPGPGYYSPPDSFEMSNSKRFPHHSTPHNLDFAIKTGSGEMGHKYNVPSSFQVQTYNKFVRQGKGYVLGPRLKQKKPSTDIGPGFYSPDALSPSQNQFRAILTSPIEVKRKKSMTIEAIMALPTSFHTTSHNKLVQSGRGSVQSAKNCSLKPEEGPGFAYDPPDTFFRASIKTKRSPSFIPRHEYVPRSSTGELGAVYDVPSTIGTSQSFSRLSRVGKGFGLPSREVGRDFANTARSMREGLPPPGAYDPDYSSFKKKSFNAKVNTVVKPYRVTLQQSQSKRHTSRSDRITSMNSVM